MPPLPNTYDEETSELIAATQRRQKDLLEFQIPRLRTCKGPLSLQQDLAAELREDVETFSRQIEALDVLVADQMGEKNRRDLRSTVDEFRAALVSIRKDSRAALLASKRTIDSLSNTSRQELLSSSAVNEKRDPNEKVTEDALMKASDDVTAALQRTIALMQGELERSVLSTQILDASTASLQSTSLAHDTLTTVMGTSKQLIVALEKSDWLDRVLIISALAFFLLVVLFILKQRILDRSIRIAFWWTRFLPDFGGDAELLRMEKGIKAATSTAASIASSAVASAVPVSAAVWSSSTSVSMSSLVSEPTDTSEAETNVEARFIEFVSSISASSIVSPAEETVAENPIVDDHIDDHIEL